MMKVFGPYTGKMKIRMHRGSLEEAMETVEEIEPTLDAVTAYLRSHWGDLYPAKAKIEVQRYAYDHRIGWETYTVTMDGCSVAFTEGPVPDAAPKKYLCVDLGMVEAFEAWVEHGLYPGSCCALLLEGKYDEAFTHAHELIKPHWEDHIAYVESLPKECRGENMAQWKGRKCNSVK